MPKPLSIFCLLICLASSLQAGELRLVTGDDYAPFTGRELPGGGVLTQVVLAAWAEQKQVVTLEWRPWARGYRETLHGDYDATFPYVRSVEREADFLYSEPLYEVRQHLFSRAGEGVEPDRLETLRGRRFCYPLGWQPPRELQRMVERGELTRHQPSGLDECARLLLLGRDDFFVADRQLGETSLALSAAPRSRFQRSAGYFSGNALHLIVARRHPDAKALIAQFNRGLRRLRDGGGYQRLFEALLR